MKKALSLLFLFLIACSAVNIAVDTSIKQGSEGFVVGDGSIGLVLTHGLGATPCEVKDLANYLAGKNITVYVVRLPGHGTSIEELDSKKWEDWYQNYKEAYMTLKPIKSKIFAAGMSVGGVIALKLAEDEDIDGVVALAPALIFDDSRSNYAWFFKYFSKYSSRTLRPECKDNTYDKSKHSMPFRTALGRSAALVVARFFMPKFLWNLPLPVYSNVSKKIKKKNKQKIFI